MMDKEASTEDEKSPVGRVSRREFLARMAAGAAATPLLGSALAGCAQTMSPAGGAGLAGASARTQGGHNILFIFTDQERYSRQWPSGFTLPARERLQQTGVTFHNHYCPATQCTPSRSVLMTGLQTPDTRMFENTDLPWIKDLSTEIPTIGHMLRKAGYYTAYKGKWHLNRGFDREADRLLNKEMEVYGFADYNSPGDIVGHQLGGYHFDHLIAGSAITWLRMHGRPLNDDGKPWALVVSLVNPHDIMYFNTDAPGERVQDTGRLMKPALRAPNSEYYKKTWDVPLPETLTEPFDAPGRPRAHLEYQKVWDYILGHVPLEAERWRRLNDFYLNSIRAVDLQMLAVLKELDALRLTDRTIIVVTSDHGEMAGAHGGMRGKGPFAYEENIHLPLHVVHPDVRGGQDCSALTAHIDIAPTLLATAGVSSGRIGELAGRELPGKDLTSLLNSPGSAGVNALREGVLFTYSGLVTVDSEPMEAASKALAAGKDMPTALGSGGPPNFKKRGTARTVFDGRYKFTRYFGPEDRNRPGTIDELYRDNDVELFDLQTDPSEVTNLAAKKGENRDLVLAMSGKLEAMIKTEIGIDDGREMPPFKDVTWTLDIGNDKQPIFD
jgi:arylsulfatase A-like enzyme